MSLWSFQGARELCPPSERSRHETGLSKLSSVRENNVEVDVILGELNSRTESKLSINGFNAYRNEFPDSLERR
jgi:hypothetical protein